MRKADYALIARIIKREIDTYRNLSSGAARLDSLQRIAREFAEGASVERVEFLKACGIE